MADEADQSEKTEDPSQKRLEDAHQKGDVPKSQELSSAFVLLGGTLVVGFLMTGPMLSMSGLFANVMGAGGAGAAGWWRAGAVAG